MHAIHLPQSSTTRARAFARPPGLIVSNQTRTHRKPDQLPQSRRLALWPCENRMVMRVICVTEGRNAHRVRARPERCPGHCGNSSTSLGPTLAAPPATQAGPATPNGVATRTLQHEAVSQRHPSTSTSSLRPHELEDTVVRLKTCAGCFTNHPPRTPPRGRCPDCIRSYERAKSARRRARRGTTSERGYDATIPTIYASRRSQPIPTARTGAQPTT